MKEKINIESALDYLQSWKHDRSSWKYKKFQQRFLLRHAYDPYMISKPQFALLLEYCRGLDGEVRQYTCRDAKERMTWYRQRLSYYADQSTLSKKVSDKQTRIYNIKLIRAQKMHRRLLSAPSQ